jgi:hypothetical protein
MLDFVGGALDSISNLLCLSLLKLAPLNEDAIDLVWQADNLVEVTINFWATHDSIKNNLFLNALTYATTISRTVSQQRKLTQRKRGLLEQNSALHQPRAN